MSVSTIQATIGAPFIAYAMWHIQMLIQIKKVIIGIVSYYEIVSNYISKVCQYNKIVLLTQYTKINKEAVLLK